MAEVALNVDDAAQMAGYLLGGAKRLKQLADAIRQPESVAPPPPETVMLALLEAICALMLAEASSARARLAKHIEIPSLALDGMRR